MKNALADYALIAAAGEADESGIIPLLEETLSEEEAMAEWLGERVPQVARRTLDRTAGARK